jgi:superfamily I DNA/RNA helicase
MLQASEEQLNVINHIKNGYNISVDAVAGSGKTTTVLSLAHHIPNKCIVQLTYNSELRREVNAKIHKLSDTGTMMLENLSVNTYHSFGYKYYSTESSTDIGICKIISGNLQPRFPLPNIEILVID